MNMEDKPQSNKKPLIILTGPTAAGKTALSVRLAQAIHGQIISADSMQVYRHMISVPPKCGRKRCRAFLII